MHRQENLCLNGLVLSLGVTSAIGIGCKRSAAAPPENSAQVPTSVLVQTQSDGGQNDQLDFAYDIALEKPGSIAFDFRGEKQSVPGD
mgnify:CR=1 FL=1